MINKVDKQTLVKFLPFLVVVGLYVFAQIHKALHMAPLPENIWDNVVLWDWARGVSVADFSTFEDDSHHRLRWGNWGIPAILIWMFSDNVIIYFLSTILPTVLASVFFGYFVWRYIGLWQTVLFFVMWYYDSELFRATFQLLPTSQALLPISIILVLTAYIADLKKDARHVNSYLLLVISLATLWLYGVKETYMAFFPAIMWLMWQLDGFRAVKILTIVMAVGYAIETIFFLSISDSFPVLGRIYAVANSGAHVNIMLSSPRYVAQQTQFFDSGITMRWAVAVGMSSIVYFMAFICCILTVAQRQLNRVAGQYSANHIAALLLLNFMVFTTFFVISISPIRLGHGLVSRYLAIALPFSYIIILYFVSQQLKDNSRWYKFAAMCIVPFYVSPAINRYAGYPDVGIHHVAHTYYVLGQEFSQSDCIRGRSKMILSNELDLIPKRFRSPELDKATKEKNFISQDGWLVVKQTDGECRNMHSVARTKSQRY